VELCFHSPKYAFMTWCLVKHRDNFTFTVTFIWLWNLDIETKGYKKTEDSRDEMHETHRRIQFIGVKVV
jgi:hypothetical protein